MSGHPWQSTYRVVESKLLLQLQLVGQCGQLTVSALIPTANCAYSINKQVHMFIALFTLALYTTDCISAVLFC